MRKFTVFSRSFWVVLSVFFALLFVFCMVGAAIAGSYGDLINNMLGINPYVKVQVDTGGEKKDMEYYKSDYVRKNADGTVMTETEIDDEGGEYTHQVHDDELMRLASERVSEQVAVEGTVLLWNDEIEGGGKALPLSDGAKISLFGSAQRVYKTYGMFGRGSGQMDPNKIDAVGGNLKSALESRGLAVNGDLYTLYNNTLTAYGNRPSDGPDWEHYPTLRVNEAPWSEISGTVSSTVGQYGDAAVMIIHRSAGEDQDIRTKANGSNLPDEYLDQDNGGKNHLELTVNEAEVLEELNNLKEAGDIGRIVLLINSDNPMQFRNIVKDVYGIDACMIVGLGGAVSYVQIADALTNSEYIVSGRTPDTMAMDNRSAPSYTNFGNFTWEDYEDWQWEYYDEENEIYYLPDPDNENDGRYTTHNSKYLVYAEGAYVGYRYYETRYEDYVFDRNGAADEVGSTAGGGWKYENEVAFPFGYGLSYTTFSYSEPEFTETDDAVQVSVTVTNTGDVTGKEVVQVYMQRPYTGRAGVEVPSIELAAFGKTDALGPDESEVVTVTVDKEQMRTYDYTTEKTYILEAGDYYFAVGNNAHDALNNVILAKDSGVDKSRMYNFPSDGEGDASFAHKVTVSKTNTEIYSVSDESGEEVEITNRISDADLNLYEGTKDYQTVEYLSRSKWDTTYPEEPVSLRLADEKGDGINEIIRRDMQYAEPVNGDVGLVEIPPEYGQNSGLTLAMMFDPDTNRAVGYTGENRAVWYDLVHQMTFEQQSQLVGRGFKMIAGMPVVAAPGLTAADGPAGVKAENLPLGKQMCFPSEPVMAATFNLELIEELGVAFGHEALHADVAEVYAPGANIHRSPYGGRNWEYFSEDPVLSGDMLCAEITGIQSKGVIVMTKHFAINEQETNRYAVATFFDEQTAREIYLRPFEIAIREGDMNGVMSSFNRVGCTWIGSHKGMLTDILRNEWGFTGICQTDSSGNVAHMTGNYNGAPGPDAANIKAEAIIAGTDLWLDGTSGEKLDWMKGLEDNLAVKVALREACVRILYNMANSLAMNGMDASTRIEIITPWWQYALIAARVVSGVLMAAAIGMAVASFVIVALKRKNGTYEPDIDLTGKKAVPVAAVAGGSASGSGSSGGSAGGSASGNSASGSASGGSAGGGSPKPPSWFARHKKLLITIGSIVAAVIVIVAIVVPVATCGGGTEGPDPGPEPEPQEHVCEHKCPVCGGCLDPDCDDPVCAVKCGDGKEAAHEYEAENAARTSGANGYMSRFTENGVTYIYNAYGNRGATLTFAVTAEEDTTASMSVTIKGAVRSTAFAEVFSVSVTSGETTTPVTTTAEVPRGTGSTAGFNEVMLGCVPLKAGLNEVTLTAENSATLTYDENGFDNGFDIDKITLYTAEAGALEADEHVCTTVCPDCGGCLDNDCTDPACGTKCGDNESYTAYIFEAEDTSDTFTEGATGMPKVEGNGDFVGGLSENEGASMTFTFEAESAGKATLYVGASYRNVERAFTDGFNVYVNDPEKAHPLESPAPVPGARSVGGNWNIWDQSAKVILGCIDLQQGTNTVVLEVKSANTNTAFNIDYIAVATDVTLPGAELAPEEPEPGEHVCDEKCPVCGKCMDMDCEDPLCAEKCGSALTKTTRLEAENAKLTDGSKGGIKVEGNKKYVGGLSENAGAKVTFEFTVSGSDDLTATLYVGSTYRSKEIILTNGFNVYVNGTLLEDRDSKVPASSVLGSTGNVWDQTFMVNIGCVTLLEGANTIVLEVKSADASTTPNLDCIELHTADGLTITEGIETPEPEPEPGDHVCESVCPVCDGCLDLTCDDPACATKCGADKPAYTLEAEEAVLKDGDSPRQPINGNGSAGDMKFVQNMNNNQGSSVTFTVNAAEATTATLTVTVNRRAQETVYTDLIGVSVNGAEKLVRPTVVPAFDAQWTAESFMEFSLGCISLDAGENTIVFTTLTTGEYSGYNFDKITLYSDAEINGATAEPKDFEFSVMSDDVIVTDSNGGSVAKNTGEQNLSATNHGAGYKKYIVTYNIYSSGATDAALTLMTSARNNEPAFGDVYAVYVNGVKVVVGDDVKMPTSGTDNIIWTNEGRVSVNISLAEGNNVVRIERLNLEALYDSASRGNYTYNFYGVIVSPETAVELVSHTCAEACPYCGKCTSASCDTGMCADKCACGDADHICARDCESVCEICGLCNDADCAVEGCVPCGCTFHPVTTDIAKTADGTNISLQGDGSISCNGSEAKYGEYTVTYKITPDSDTTVGLYIRTTSQRVDNLLKDMYGVKVNGADVTIDDSILMPYNDKDMWNDIRYTYVGEIELTGGEENTIEIVRYSRDGLEGNLKEFTGYNFFGIALS